jgi:hypothetical protein
VARSTQIPAGPSQLFIVPWGGAVARPAKDSSPLAGREATFVVHPLLMWEEPSDDERMVELGRSYRGDLRPYASGAAYLNFLGDEGEGRVRAGFAEGAFERIVQLKRKWDPDNVFHGNQTLQPAATRPGGAQ